MLRMPIKAGTTREIAIPPGAIADPGSKEILRCWIAHGGLHVTLDPAFPTPEAWGILLADLVRHAARAFAAQKTCSESDASMTIRAMFDAEWTRPTDPGTTSPLKKQ